MSTLTAVVAGGAFMTAGTWSPAQVPTAADDCFLDATSGPVTIGVGSLCRSLNLTGYLSTVTHTAGVTLTIGDATAGLGDVALEFPASGWTYTLGSAATSAITFVSTSATQQTVNFNGKTVGPVTFNAATNGSWRYTGTHVNNSSSATLLLTKGSLDLNGQTITLLGTSVLRSNAAGNVRSLTLGAATITAGNWDMGTGVNLAFSGASATLTMAGVSTTFNGGGKTYGTVTLAAGAGVLAIAGANTFTAFVVTAPRTVRFTAGTITTFLTPPTLVGAAGNPITISSVTAATHTLSLAAGTVQSDYLSLTNSTATGGAIWNAGPSSTDNGGNTGWLFGTVLLTPAQWRWQAETPGVVQGLMVPPAQWAWGVLGPEGRPFRNRHKRPYTLIVQQVKDPWKMKIR